MVIVARVLLVLVFLLSAYIALKPGYNMAQWTPNRWMRSVGFSYETVLAYEHHFHWFLHLAVGFLATNLLYLSRLYFSDHRKPRLVASCILMATISVGLEFWQRAFGKSVEIADILFGLAGIALAALSMFLVNSRFR